MVLRVRDFYSGYRAGNVSEAGGVKSFLQNRSNRFGFDGWALRFKDSASPMDWTVSTTRAECRALRKERSDLFLDRAEIVKVRIDVSVVE